MSETQDPPPPFQTWEECRDYYALESIFLGKLLDRRPGAGNQRRYEEASQKAIGANDLCEEPLPRPDLTEQPDGEGV